MQQRTLPGENQARNSSPRRNLPQPRKDLARRNGLRLSRLEARDALRDLRFPCGFRTRFGFEFHAVQKLTRQREALLGRQNQRIVSDGIKCGRHGGTLE